MALNLYTVLHSFFWCNFYGRLSSKVPSHFIFENIDYVTVLLFIHSLLLLLGVVIVYNMI